MDSHILSTQWATRPADERFTDMQMLHEHNLHKRAISAERGVALDHMAVFPTEGGGMLFAQRGETRGAHLTHWAFGQLCARVGAPAAYLRSLPSQLAAVPMQWSIEHGEAEDAKVLLRKNDGWSADAITSTTYGRIYDSQVSEAVIKTVDLARWKIPSASYATRDPKRATTLYASDRDMFVCLVDDSRPIEVPGSNGKDTLYRGFIIRNSEVGAAALDITLFLYRYICDNRIIWGMQSERSLKIRHSSGGPMRYLTEARPLIAEYSAADTREEVQMVLDARKREVGKDPAEVRTWLKARGFTQEQTRVAVDNAEKSGESPRSVWGIVQGLTAAGHDIPFGDERFAFERKVGGLLG